MTGERRPVLLVSGLSGAGKSSILRILEDLGHEAVDNPPLSMIAEIIRRGAGPVAIGVDVRTSGFDAGAVLEALARLRADPALRPELLFAVAEEAVLLRRYTATRRRHPLAGGGGVSGGIAAEIALTAPLRADADLVIDTSDLRPPELRRLVEARYTKKDQAGVNSLTVSLVSFAFPAGLPRDSDMVFDARFLRNPFYDPTLSPMTGLDRPVAEYVEADPDYLPFVDRIYDLLRMLLPRFVFEGKKYVTLACGCSGGRHRSVTVIEALARRLGSGHLEIRDQNRNEFSSGVFPYHVRVPVIVMHRELARTGTSS